MKFTRFAAGFLAVMLLISSVAYAATYPKLQRGDSGTQVKEMQQALRDLGYTLTVDGRFGAGTEKVVKAFQKDQKLMQDGVAGNATLTRLYALQSDQNGSTQDGTLRRGALPIYRKTKNQASCQARNES